MNGLVFRNIFVIQCTVYLKLGIFQVLIFTSLLTIVFIGLVKPFETKKLNIIEIINETCILGASYHLLVFTDYVSNDDIQ